MFSYFKPLIFGLDPETAHDLAIKSLKLNVIPEKLFKVENEEVLEISFINNKIKNPIGLAAGFDKSAEAYNSLFKLGFGFIEIGTVTPLKQFGNPKPRIFRLQNDNALINRLGFNNDGIEVIKKRIQSEAKNGILGINIGPNKETKDQKNDFCVGIKNFFDMADYITINISSPNTEGLRDFHDKEKLKDLLSELDKIKKINKTNNIAVAFVGDGATSEGDFHEALNLASVWNLPVIFVIENNGYGLSTPNSEQYACKTLADRGIGYGIDGITIDGNDIIEVYNSTITERTI